MSRQSEKGNVVLKILLPVLLLALGVGVAWRFMSSAPRPGRGERKAATPLVDVMTVRRGPVSTKVKCMGVVAPAIEVELNPEVSGTIIHMADGFAPGGRINQGDEILTLDPRDYEIEVVKQKSAVAQAAADVQIEDGYQKVVKDELKYLQDASRLTIKETDLVLRKPNYAQVLAVLASAKADLDKARLDLDRTKITAPFNALVIERDANIGAYVSEQEALGTLVGTDEYWIEAAVPLDRLANIDFDAKGGAPARIISQTGEGEWTGRALRPTGTLTDKTRMAKVLITVADPLGLKKDDPGPTLVLDDYVSVEIEGRPLANAVALPRETLREGGVVWVLSDGRLDIREVDPVWKDGEHIYIASGLEDGDQVVMTELGAPVAGMRLTATGGGEDKKKLAQNGGEAQ